MERGWLSEWLYVYGTITSICEKCLINIKFSSVWIADFEVFRAPPGLQKSEMVEEEDWISQSCIVLWQVLILLLYVTWRKIKIFLWYIFKWNFLSIKKE